MNDETSFQQEFDPGDPGASYRPVNGVAILSLIVALFSLLSIGLPALLVLNVLAAIFAIVALVKINRQPRYVGSLLAQIALFLTTAAATISAGYHFGTSQYLNRVAKGHAETMIKLFYVGNFQEAFAYQGVPIPGSGGEKSKLASEVARWVQDPPLSIVKSDQGQGVFRFLGSSRAELGDHLWRSYACDFEYEPESADLEKSVFKMVFVRRNFPEKKTAEWRFIKFEIISGPRPSQGINMF